MDDASDGRFPPRECREAAANWLGVDLEDAALKRTVDRLEALAGIYDALDEADLSAESGSGDEDAGDRFEAGPRPPTPSSDPYNAWLHRCELRRTTSGPLVGVTVGLKDNICVRGLPLTVGSRAFEGIVPAGHARVVDRLLNAGATIAGKTNMDELAFSPTGETSAFGAARNPVDPGHVTGGSSSGSAAAVRSGDVAFALGTDTGGSVRIPASFTGLVGIKPTYGRVPLHGVVELAYSLDHVGVLARSVETAARGLEVIADDREPLVVTDPSALGREPSDLVVGVPERLFEGPVTEAVETAVRGELERLSDRGTTVRTVALPSLEPSRPSWWGIAPVEFATMLATDGVGVGRTDPVEPSLAASIARVRRASFEALGTNIQEMLVLGATLMHHQHGRHYVRAQRLRRILRREVDETLADVDVLASPTTPMTALELGAFDRGTTPPVNWDTHPTNLTGHPSISVPCSTTDEGGLPIGLQFIGAMDDEQTLFDVAETVLEERAEG